MSHNHHDHHHHHDSSQSMGLAFLLNTVFMVIEFIGGLMTGSTAILSDAVHDLGDSIALASAWLMEKKSLKPADSRYTFGYRRLSSLSALLNATILVAGSLWVVGLSISRFWQPTELHVEGMLALAILGTAVNGFAAIRIIRKTNNLNQNVMRWHLLEDALGWLAVLIGAIIIRLTGWTWIDPLLAILVAIIVGSAAFRSLQKAYAIISQQSPEPELYDTIKARVEALEAVDSAHHLRLWTQDGESHVLSLHVVTHEEITSTQYQALKQELKHVLAEFHIDHSTVEIEYPQEVCRLDKI
ncbi:cation diffusion facilitator family transporter [Gynuella sunshinyii]|uniref:Co/Zn/Cd efflux system component n=1 Tax=Gynuella sunshinyii YC6258 TaxID=1445510 RepID=A0A0C5VD74_9GAMM|nr:cation diffusion facilitator family transporter [Gynuella sunshinyii]AJQ92492.1 co/Zn/Cd efflux system component [Gynuella sunshinyii YC6258]